MIDSELFSILDIVDSTNNYAMRFLHEQKGKHGMAWFAMEQTAGKGQRGKNWVSAPGQNIVLSIILQPQPFFKAKPFVFNAVIALCCRAFLQQYLSEPVSIKWPNDLFIGDRKAGGILIENIYRGNNWQWAVVGLGINVNQTDFGPAIQSAVSLASSTSKNYDSLQLAKELYSQILQHLHALEAKDMTTIMHDYNQYLYKKGAMQRFKSGSVSFETEIVGVNEYGQLLTNDGMERKFEFGTLEWIFST